MLFFALCVLNSFAFLLSPRPLRPSGLVVAEMAEMADGKVSDETSTRQEIEAELARAIVRRAELEVQLSAASNEARPVLCVLLL